ncbi:EF-hand domain-containing protein [Marinobacter sp. M216]|uniref:EF-hand domain-containing protein n=1 Tax=Marinobacter albus TaxID=3030833 RepID=A0ABT7HD37_9GAMM|nr:EF-hand domain-containing protein [Marinobacter sp. M216]MDK9557937.1 EF-hand domain-containing protein [Marinobacter sp. M216]
MFKWMSALIAVTGVLVSVGCSTSEVAETTPGQKLSPGAKGQFQCADRNGNDYIDQSELIYMRQCGIGEDLKCGDVPEGYGERPPAEDFELGLRLLQITDADGDDRISRLEFRAHCNSAGKPD